MRIAVSGVARQSAIEKLEKELNVVALSKSADTGNELIDYAAESYLHFDKSDVLFDGTVLDVTDFGSSHEGVIEVYEQIIISALLNYDRVFVVTDGMDNDRVVLLSAIAALVGNQQITLVPNADAITL